jgi:hypothetical protein
MASPFQRRTMPFNSRISGNPNDPFAQFQVFQVFCTGVSRLGTLDFETIGK